MLPSLKQEAGFFKETTGTGLDLGDKVKSETLSDSSIAATIPNPTAPPPFSKFLGDLLAIEKVSVKVVSKDRQIFGLLFSIFRPN
ncbi:hypothetical protein OIU77_005523 [Salix suchowensis]|uniref:Uncharacterized protein n=1 Tax=Salix suchowensis TaxID=1278906 RepID=A0ABQ9APN2_9ROSI|nr:hypothetical protein OIU77_005523 [Salix suchowensis]